MDQRPLRSFMYIVLFIGLVIAIFSLPNTLNLWKQRRARMTGIPGGTSFPVTVHDVCDRDVTIPHRPARIISLAPGVTEILFAIGDGDRVIAATNYCNYPEAANHLPKIGGYLDPNLEKITSLKPDLIVGMRGNKRDVLDRLYSLGLPIVVIDPTTLDEIPQGIKLIGRVTGSLDEADDAARTFGLRRKSIENLLATVTPAMRPRVLFLFSTADQGGIFTAGPGSHIDELIALSGGINIAASAGKPWPQLSMETVAAANPQIILISRMSDAGNPLTAAKALADLRAKTAWRSIDAVKSGKVYMMDSVVTVPGPRLIDVLEQMTALLHPALFPKSEPK